MADPKYMRRSATAAVAGLVLLIAGGGVAGTLDAVSGTTGFAAVEYAVFGSGASATWQQTDRRGGGEFGRVTEPTGGGIGNLGPKFKAGLLSLLLPGAGQYYNGDRRRALVFGAAEVAIWTSWYVFDRQGDNRTTTYEEYAAIHAGTSGDHNDSYWQSVASYMDSDRYNEIRLRNARAEGAAATLLVADADAWQWQTEDDLDTFQQLRGDAIRAYDRRDFVILFFIVNRAISAYDAVRSAGGGGAPQLEVAGFDVGFDVQPSLSNPVAKCVFSRSF